MAETYTRDNKGLRIDHTTVSSRYSVTNDDSLNAGINHLNEHGYAVFSDVLTNEEVQINKGSLWDFFENIPGRQIRRDDPSTWSSHWPGINSHGVINDCGIGQSDFMWNIRANRNIKRIYAGIWNTNALLVSFDGCGVFRDWRYDRQWKSKAGWYHVDQNPRMKPDRCCVQGFVSLTDQNETTGGLIVFPRTHLRFAQIEELGRRPRDFVMIPDTHPILDRGQAIGKLIQCQAGDFVVWDSRLVHCNSPSIVPQERDSRQPVELLRIVAYVSMSPTIFIRGQTVDHFRKQRKIYAQNNSTMSHWSTELQEASSTDGLPKVSLKKLDAYQRALLLGMDPDEEY